MTDEPKPPPTLFRASLLTALATLASRAIGLVRDVSLAAFFSKELTDIFWGCFRVPNALRQVFGEGAVTVAFLPTLERVKKEHGPEEARKFLGASLCLLLLATGLATLLGILLAPYIVGALLDFSPEIQARATGLVRLMFPYLIPICLAAVVGATLNARGSFFTPAITPVFFNLSIVTAAWIVYRGTEDRIEIVAIGVLVGGTIQLLCQAPTLWKTGYGPRFRGIWGGSKSRQGIGQFFLLFMPAAFTLGIRPINTLVTTYFASTVGAGSISYLFYADRLTQLPLGVFGFAIATAAFPRFSKGALETDREAIRSPLVQSLKGNVLVLVPSMVGIWLLADPLVELLFNRGRFAEEAGLAPTVLAVRVYSLGLLPFSFGKLFASLGYALGKKKTPLVAALASAAVNLALAYYLRFTALEHAGIALAVVLASVTNVVVLVFLLRNSVRLSWFEEIAGLAGRVAVAAGAMGFALWCWVSWTEGWSALWVAPGGVLLGGGIYLGCGWVLFRERIVERFKRK